MRTVEHGGVGMRVMAAVIVVLLASASARAEGDHKTFYGPPTAQSKPAAKTKASSRSSGKPSAAATAKPRDARSRDAHARNAKPRPDKPENTGAVAGKPGGKAPAEPARAKPGKTDPAKPKLAKGEAGKPDPVTTGTAAAGAQPAAAGLSEAYAALPFAERIALQSDLIWTGDYNGLLDGAFSDRLVEAVKSYQKRNKNKVTGILGAQEREALAAAVRPIQTEVGWRLVEDPATGARVGIPTALATQSLPGTSGTRWSSAQGQLQIETFRIDTGATLEGLFEQQKKETARRKVKYSVLRPDYFVVSGTLGLKKFYTRTFTRNGELRGLTVLYDQAMEGTMDRIVVAMSSAFMPFAGYTVASAGNGSQRKVEYGTGVVVSAAGHIVAAGRLVAGCHVIAVPRLGHAERVAEDADGALALLRVYGAAGLVPIGWSDAAAAGGDVRLVGVADPQAQAGGAAVTAVAARLGADAHALEAPPVPGFSGAAAVDRRGRLRGITVVKPAVVAGSAGTAFGPHAVVVPAARVRAFLQQHGVDAGGDGADATASVVRVICVRK